MNVTFACPHCDRTNLAEFDATTRELACEDCSHHLATPADAASRDRVQCCLVCGGGELFARKDFSQPLGVTIVVLGLAASCVPWYFHYWYATFAILFGTALVDVVLYIVMGNVLECYRCRAQYRGVQGIAEHGAFRLEVYERHRQQAARLEPTKSVVSHKP
jgi:hypothetical protein